LLWPAAARAADDSLTEPAILASLLLAGVAAAFALVALRAHRKVRRLAAALGASEAEAARLKSLLDLLPIPVWWHRADLSVGFANQGFANIAGDPREAAGGSTLATSRDLANRALATSVEQTESVHVAVGGQRRLYSLAAQPIPAGGVGVFATDQTVAEALQSDLARHVAANAEVLENLSTAIAIYGPDRRLKFANHAFADLWRLEEGWLSGEPTIQEVLEALRERRRLPEYADFPAFKRDQVNLFQSLIDTREELQHLPDETTLRMVVTPHPFGGLMFTYEDVTDRLALERSYNTLIEVQRETLNNLHEGVLVIGGDGRLKLYNPAYARIWDQGQDWLNENPTLNDLIEDSNRFFSGLTDWDGYKARMIGELSARIPRHGLLSRSDGTAIEYSSVPLPDGASLFTYVDVSDRARVERALRERNQALEAADRLKTEFIANVSYELRTPLNTILGFSEILANQYFGELTARQLEYANGILDSCQQLLSLINDILDLATIEAGYMALDLGEVDLHTLLASVLSLTRERAKNQQLTLSFDCPPGIGSIRADPRRVKQAIFNLLSNSCKFTPPGGTITLAARRHRGEVAIEVTDTGVGIPEQDQARVFERFERGVIFGRQSGAGLGLSLVKSFVELHGGRVELTSSPGKGTTVTCFLPEVAAEAAPRLPAAGE
jgi:signal transduction histidine kinase